MQGSKFSNREKIYYIQARRGRYGRKTRALWTQDAGAMDARRGHCGRKTRALWTQDAGRRSVKIFLGSTVVKFIGAKKVKVHGG